MKNYIKLRYSLIPYIYTNARYAYDESISICRPMYYEYPESEEAYQIKNEYFFGNDIIANPITKPIGKDSLFTLQSTWLPEGKWFEWQTGTLLDGNRIVNRSFTVDEMPLYVREGAIIPMQPDMKNTSAQKVDPLILNIFPGEKGVTKIYDDAGDDQNFKKGAYSFTDVSFNKSKNKINVEIKPVMGKYKGMLTERAYEIRIINSFPALNIKVNGEEIKYSSELKKNSWTYNGEDLSVRIFTNSFSVNRKVDVAVELQKEDPGILSGKKEKIKRLALFTDFLAGKRTFWNQDVWNDGVTPSGPIIRASQIDYLVTKDPDSVDTELKNLDNNWYNILSMLKINAVKNNFFTPYFELLKATGK